MITAGKHPWGIALVVAGSLLASAWVRGDPSPKILARIGTHPITDRDLETRLRRLPPEVQKRYAGPQGERDYLRELVRLEVFARAARDQGLDRDPEIQARIRDIANALLAHQYVQRQILGPVRVTDEEVRAYYREHRDRFVSPERVQAPSILISVPPRATEADWRDARDRAQALVEQLRAGADFKALERQHSADKTTGKYAFYDRFRLVPELADRVFALQVGDVSEPIRVSNGYRIFKMLARKPARNQPFREVAQAIYEQLLRERRDVAYEAAERQLFQRYGVILSEPGTGGTGSRP